MGWGCVMSRAVDLRERVERSLGEMQESGAAEICELLSEMIHPSLLSPYRVPAPLPTPDLSFMCACATNRAAR
jgi:hypothetical protein